MAEIGRVRLSVFKGRKARLNRVIFEVLAQHGPLTIYDLRKRVRAHKDFRYTRYSVINRRVRTLREEDFLKIVEVREARKAPQPSLVYKITLRADLAMLLDTMDLDWFIRTADEARVAVVLNTLSPQVD